MHESQLGERRRLTISLENRDYEELAQLAKAHGLSLSWLISKAVQRFLVDENSIGLGRLLDQQQAVNHDDH